MLHDALAHALFSDDNPDEVTVPEQYQPPPDETHEAGAAAAVYSPRRPLAASAPPLSYSPRAGQPQLPTLPPYDKYADHASEDSPHGHHTQPTLRVQVGILWLCCRLDAAVLCCVLRGDGESAGGGF